jgi:hypothetical protein
MVLGLDKLADALKKALPAAGAYKLTLTVVDARTEI